MADGREAAWTAAVATVVCCTAVLEVVVGALTCVEAGALFWDVSGHATAWGAEPPDELGGASGLGPAYAP